MLKKKFLYIFGILFFLLIIELLSLIFLHINKKFNRVYFKDADLEKTFIENSKNNLISFYFSKNYSQELGWDNNPDNTRLNSIGARNDFENQKKKKKYFTFGSSFTWGDGVDENETWQYYLSKEYDSYIANYGVGGYSAYQAYLKFKKKQNLSNRFEGVILTIFESEIDRIKNHYLNFYFESGIRIRPVPKIENNNLIHTPLPFFNKKKTFYKEYLDFIGKSMIEDPWWKRRVEIKFPYTYFLIKFISLKIQDKIEFNLIYNDFKNTWSNKKTNKVFVKIIDNFVYDAKNSNLKPIIVLLPRIRNKLSSGYKFNDVYKKLKNKNYCVINFSDFINMNKIKNNQKTVLNDGHYSTFTYKLLSKYMYEEIKKCNF
tara:strand:+ start:307 stop:1425 length:1119 start_codon:yes stop_codon:yes gene_type:complete